MKKISIIFIIVFCLICVNFLSAKNKEVSKNTNKKYFEDKELEIIKKAAKRNNCQGDDFIILLTIRKVENGSKGKEFGILSDVCKKEMKKRPNDTLDIQAGWAAATIVKNRQRWEKSGKKGDFIEFLQKKYCPVGAKNDPKGLNKNWLKNAKNHYNIFKNIDWNK